MQQDDGSRKVVDCGEYTISLSLDFLEIPENLDGPWYFYPDIAEAIRGGDGKQEDSSPDGPNTDRVADA